MSILDGATRECRHHILFDTGEKLHLLGCEDIHLWYVSHGGIVEMFL